MSNTNQLIYQASVQSIFLYAADRCDTTQKAAVIIYLKIWWISGEDPQGNQAKIRFEMTPEHLWILGRRY
jgi:hypothetical protein